MLLPNFFKKKLIQIHLIKYFYIIRFRFCWDIRIDTGESCTLICISLFSVTVTVIGGLLWNPGSHWHFSALLRRIQKISEHEKIKLLPPWSSIYTVTLVLIIHYRMSIKFRSTMVTILNLTPCHWWSESAIENNSAYLSGALMSWLHKKEIQISWFKTYFFTPCSRTFLVHSKTIVNFTVK